MRQRRLTRLSTKQTERHIDINEWMRKNSGKLKLSDLARPPTYYYDQASDNNTVHSEEMVSSASEEFRLNLGMVSSPTIDIKTSVVK